MVCAQRFHSYVLVLDRPSVLYHTDSQHPPSLSNICCWAFCTRELSTQCPSHPSSLIFPSLLWGISWGYSCKGCLLIFSLMSLMYDRNTLSLIRPLRHPSKSSAASSWLLASGTHLPSHPSGDAFFHLPGQPLMKAVCNARLYLWMVVWAVVEAAVRVCGFPVHTDGQFTSILFHMDVEERKWSFSLLHGELDFCALTIQMVKETCGGLLSVPSAQTLTYRSSWFSAVRNLYSKDNIHH